MHGWIKLHRKLLLSNCFKNPKALHVWIYCLLKASHKEHDQMVGRQKIKLLPGQFIYGRSRAAEELNMKKSTVNDYIKILQKAGKIDIRSNNKFSLITIVNWDFYQHGEEKPDIKSDSKSTSNGHQMGTNKNGKNGKEEYVYEFEQLWKLYPNKKGKSIALKKYPSLRKKHTFEELRRAIERYAAESKGKDAKYIKYGSTFFNGGYEDYLDQNYKQEEFIDAIEQARREGVIQNDTF